MLKDVIEELDLEFDRDLDAYRINEMQHSDSRIDELASKVNEIIAWINQHGE
jgi:hypothetical protein